MLMDEFAALPFAPVEFRGFTVKRRAIHLGVGYNFDHREVSRAPHLPEFLMPIGGK